MSESEQTKLLIESTEDSAENSNDLVITSETGSFLAVNQNRYFQKCHSKNSKGCNVDLWTQRNLNFHLLQAVYENDLNKVKLALQHGADPNSTCRTYKFTALHLAVFAANENIVTFLIKKGACVNSVDQNGLTALHYAAWYNRHTCIDILLNEIHNTNKNNYINLRANQQCPIVKEYLKDSLDHTCPNYVSEFDMIIDSGATALHVACQRINHKCVEVLLKHQDTVDLKDSRGLTAFEVLGEHFETIKNEKYLDQNFLKIIKLLQNYESSSNHLPNDIQYFSPVHAAVLLCSAESIKLLLKESKFNICLDRDGQTPIHLAIVKQLEVSLIALIECIEDVSIYRNSVGITPFQTSVEAQWIEGVGLLLDANANVAEVAADGRTVLHVAAVCGNNELLEELLELEETEKILNAQNDIGETPIYCAISSGNVNCVTALVDKNVDLNIRLNGNINILHRAAEYGNEEILTVLLNIDYENNLKLLNDCDILSYSGMTPLQLAAFNNNIECVETLLNYSECDYKKKVTSSLYYGAMAIHLAASRGFENVVEILLNHDNDQLSAVDNKGRSPLHCAALQCQRSCIELLLKRGADLSSYFEDESALDIIYRNVSRPTEFLETVFDQAIYIDDKNTLITDKHCMININFNILIPQNEDFNQMSILSNILFNGKSIEQKKLLLHPLIESFLYIKWNKMSKIFWLLLLLYAIFVLSLTSFVISLFYYRDENRPQFFSNIEFLRFALISSLLSVLIPEILLIHKKLKQYTINTDRIIKWSSLILVIILMWVHPSNHQAVWLRHLATIAVLTSWIEMMFMLSKVPTWGYYVQMFFKVSQNVIKVMTVFSFLVIGFALAFMIEFQTTEPFTNPLGGFIKTIVMMTAELDFSDLFTGENAANAEVINLTIYMLFLMMGTVVLMNLLVGLAVSDIHDLEIIGKIDRHAQQIVFLSMLESDTLTRFLPEKYKTKLIQQKCVPETFKIYPSNPKCNVMKLLPCTLKENIIDIAEDNVRRESDISNIQLKEKIDELKDMIDDLKTFIESSKCSCKCISK